MKPRVTLRAKVGSCSISRDRPCEEDGQQQHTVGAWMMSLGDPLPKTSAASLITSASTQPPETEP
jgi:hypothetical protein